jgi:leucyl aminopeptidase
MTPHDKCPEKLAERAALEAVAAGCEVEVWDEARITAERFGGLLGVAAGSTRPPRFVVVKYQGKGAGHPHYALVGKGVTFDSGGLSLKPSGSMEDMKNDMTGAAVVLAVVTRAAQLKLPVNVVAYMPMTENMTGGLATKLGDVLTMRDGTTVEILNTDAEGRLILADALAYAAEQKPAAMIDLATLTGACMVALGHRIAGLCSNNDALVSELMDSTKRAGERLWRLPIDEDFKDQLKSNVADLKNVGSKGGGAITAAKFLQHFVGETNWAHLDIAGPSWSDADSATRDAGGTGCYVATLVDWLKEKAN